MKRHLTLVVLVFASLAWSGDAAKASAARDEIEDLLEVYIRAEEQQDAEALMDLYAHGPDVTSITDGTILTGWDEIQRETRLIVQAQRAPRITLGQIKISFLDKHHALVVASYTNAVHIASGPVEIQGAWTLVVERQRATWKIIHEHTSD